MFGRNYLCFKCFPHYTEYQSVRCHILGGINIMHAHWGGIQPVPEPQNVINFKKLDSPGRGQVTGSALQKTCREIVINLAVIVSSGSQTT